MNVLDLCAGTGSATEAFVQRGHSVFGVELDAALCSGNVLQGDILELAADVFGWLDRRIERGWMPDHVHASPPCDGFAVPSIGRMWEKDLDVLKPKHPTAEMGLRLLDATANIILILRHVNPELTFTVENPRAMMRRAVAERHRWMGKPREAMYCRYGPLGPVPVVCGPPLVWAQKATDFWSNLPNWEPLACHARPPRAAVGPGPEGLQFTYRDGEPCHERAARGAKAGLQRMKGSTARSRLPLSLSLSLSLHSRRSGASRRKK